MKKQSLLIFAVFLACFMGVSPAQVQVAPYLNSKIQLFDTSGLPCAGCTLSFFAAGTTTPQNAYTDSTGSTPTANPLTLDSAGMATVYLSSASYKIVLKSALGVTIFSQDGVTWNNLATTLSSLTVTAGDAVVQSNGASSGNNQNSPNLKLCGSFFTGISNSSDCWGFDDVVGVGSTPTSTLTVSHAGSGGTPLVSVPFNVSLGSNALTAGSVNSVQFVNTQTDAGIAAAISAVADGGMVFLPQGTYTLCNNLPITISKRVTIQGAGWGTVLQVCAGASATTDVFLLKPSTVADVQGMRFQDFYITPQSGTPGRSAFMVDGTNASVSNLVIDHVRVDKLGSYAFNIQNVTGTNSSTNGTPYSLTIRDSTLTGGLNLTKAGDTINLLGNTITGAGDLTINQVGAAASDGGAHGLMILGNNITVCGGTIIQNAWQGALAYNDIEQPCASTEANSALVDVQGNASANVQNFKIIGNYLGATSANVNIGVRVDKATATIIEDNYMVQGASSGATVTANATRTQFVNNRHAPANAISSWLSDSGTATFSEEVDNASSVRQLLGVTRVGDASNAIGTAFGNGFFRLKGSIGVYGWTTGTGDPSTSGATTGLSTTGAGVVAVGNGTQGDASGTVNAASYQIAGVGPSGSGALARVTSPALVTPTIGGETITKAPRMTFGAFISGNLTAVQNFQSWIPDQAITITRVTATVATAPVTCSPNAVVSAVVIGGATLASATVSAGVGNDSGAVSVNVAAGTSIGVRVTTAAAGCGTSPANANVTVEYQMQ